MKKLNTSGFLSFISPIKSGNKKTITKTIFNKVLNIKVLKTVVLSFEYL